MLIFFCVLLIIPLLPALYYGFGTLWTHVERSVRARFAGQKEWYRLISESRSDSTGSSVEQQMSAIRALSSDINSPNMRLYLLQRPTISFVWHYNEQRSEWELYLCCTGNVRSATVRTLARNINCTVDSSSQPPDIPTAGLVTAKVGRIKKNVGRIPSTLGELAKRISNSPQTGTFIMTLETMQYYEIDRYERYYREESIRRGGRSAEWHAGSDSSFGDAVDSAMRASFGAISSTGSPRDSELLLGTAMGGISTLTSNYSKSNPLNSIVSGAFLWSLFYSAFAGLGLLAAITLNQSLMPAAWAFAGVALALLIISILVYRPLVSGMLSKWLQRGEIVMKPHNFMSLSYFLRQKFNPRRMVGLGRQHEDVRDGLAAPSSKLVFTVHAAAIAEVVSVPTDSRVMNVSSMPPMIPAPASLEGVQSRDCSFIGKDGDREPITMPLNTLNYGFAALGSPGSGKTNFLQLLFAHSSMASRENTFGYKITPIWGEASKGEGAYDAWRIVGEMHPQAIMIDTHNPASSYRLALEGPRLADGIKPGDVVQNCRSLTANMQYAWGEDIKSASREFLDYVFRISMLLLPEEIEDLGFGDLVDAQRPNIIRLALLIMASNPNLDPGPMLLGWSEDMREERKADERKRYLYDAIINISNFLDPKNRRTTLERAMAPRNKLTDLVTAEEMWTPRPHKQDVYVSGIINNFAPVVLNMAAYWDADQGKFSAINSDLSRRCLRMYVHSQWEYIKVNCMGWESMGRFTPCYFDEVRDVAAKPSGDLPNVVEDVQIQGRSYGHSLNIGAQDLNQVPEEVLHQLLSYRNRAWFGMENSNDLSIGYQSLVQGDQHAASNFSQANLASLPKGMAVVKTYTGSGTTIPFTLLVPMVMPYAEILRRVGDTGMAVDRYDDEYTYTGAGLSGALTR